MDGISNVLQRIDSIQQRFGYSSVPLTKFSTVLAGAERGNSVGKNSSIGEKNMSTGENNSLIGEKKFASDEISKIIQFTAQKYGVDPKLAMAVAKVESNLSSDVVSPVGAVGVMQLMPETAQGLGVRNSKDPRDNIDGGVRYLKQLIGTFDGDITKAVAAYNAGPQAVKNYNGIPPYSETKSYVAKVMALYK